MRFVNHDEIIVFDLETTGTNPVTDSIIEIGAVKLKDLEVVDSFNTFVDPHRELSEFIVNLTGISGDMLKGAPDEGQALAEFKKFCGDKPLFVAHNADFDCGFIRETAKRSGVPFEFSQLDTVVMSRKMLPELEKHKLNYVAEHFGFVHDRSFDLVRPWDGALKRIDSCILTREEYLKRFHPDGTD